jgi:hypothetical protein
VGDPPLVILRLLTVALPKAPTLLGVPDMSIEGAALGPLAAVAHCLPKTCLPAPTPLYPARLSAPPPIAAGGRRSLLRAARGLMVWLGGGAAEEATEEGEALASR